MASGDPPDAPARSSGTALPASAPSRAQRAVEAFVGLADAMAADVEPADLLRALATGCSQLLDGSEVGVLLVTAAGDIQLTASSSTRMHRVELVEMQEADGPCIDVYRTGEAIVNGSVVTDRRWPHFAPEARAAGYRVVHALPLRHRGEVFGVVNVFDAEPTTVDPSDVRSAQALADITAFAIAQTRAVEHSTETATRLQEALRSRVVIEQAKGSLAEQLGTDLDGAFALLRDYSRNTNTALAETARQVVGRELTARDLVAAGRPKRSTRPRPPKPPP